MATVSLSLDPYIFPQPQGWFGYPFLGKFPMQTHFHEQQKLQFPSNVLPSHPPLCFKLPLQQKPTPNPNKQVAQRVETTTLPTHPPIECNVIYSRARKGVSLETSSITIENLP